ncbi:ABC transporter permease [Pseudoroseicyclus tamaricis]|uniref:ABC transporter permease n=1 Tax=Pseudoroseicyclus tamaricis TaxID=2705421 RepID=UPI001F43B5C0|nr:ABC transporter permease [Pseudoroseicyclus tamaricis]
MSDPNHPDPATNAEPKTAPGGAGRILRALRSASIVRSLRKDWVAMLALAVLLILMFAAALPNLLAPYRVFDLTQIQLMNAFRPPAWLDGGSAEFLLGTDDQGRDILSAIIYGLRVSVTVGLGGVALAVVIGVTIGLIAGYAGGFIDSLLMRVADVQLTFPAILIAVMIDGVSRAILGNAGRDNAAVIVLIIAIGLSGWVEYARAVRGATMVERHRDYVASAQLSRVGTASILFNHILPNVLTAVLVIGTIHLGVAILIEATLSFVGLGIPPTQPSLGTLIRVGNNYILSGEWWIAIMPGFALLVLVLAINLLGDFLRDALNPRLK